MIVRGIGHVMAGQSRDEGCDNHDDGPSTAVRASPGLLRFVKNGVLRLLSRDAKASRDLPDSRPTP